MERGFKASLIDRSILLENPLLSHRRAYNGDERFERTASGESRVIEIRFHGRGGQGAVVASKILAVAAVNEDFFVQSFPSFGVERRGAPVAAFTRIDTQYIRLRTNIYSPDHVIVLDPSLIGQIDPLQGMKESGWVILNADPAFAKTISLGGRRAAAINASEVAVRHGLGTKTSPIVNTAILGAALAATGMLKLESLEKAIQYTVPEKAERNIAAARDAYNEVVIITKELQAQR